jgi:hypothetical protein
MYKSKRSILIPYLLKNQLSNNIEPEYKNTLTEPSMKKHSKMVNLSYVPTPRSRNLDSLRVRSDSNSVNPRSSNMFNGDNIKKDMEILNLTAINQELLVALENKNTIIKDLSHKNRLLSNETEQLKRQIEALKSNIENKKKQSISQFPQCDTNKQPNMFIKKKMNKGMLQEIKLENNNLQDIILHSPSNANTPSTTKESFNKVKNENITSQIEKDFKQKKKIILRKSTYNVSKPVNMLSPRLSGANIKINYEYYSQLNLQTQSKYYIINII